MTKEEMEERRLYWKDQVAAFKESGQSARAWCAANNLKDYQLHYWLKKYDCTEKEAPSSDQWISVEVEKKPVFNDNNTLTIKVDAAMIEVKPGFDPVLLRDVVKALGTTC